jgi:hypothetical protein
MIHSGKPGAYEKKHNGSCAGANLLSHCNVLLVPLRSFGPTRSAFVRAQCESFLHDPAVN